MSAEVSDVRRSEQRAENARSLPPDLWERFRGRELRARLGVFLESELALLLDVSVHTLQAWRSQGSGPAYVRSGRLVYYTEASLKEWLNKNLRASTSVKLESEDAASGD